MLHRNDQKDKNTLHSAEQYMLQKQANALSVRMMFWPLASCLGGDDAD